MTYPLGWSVIPQILVRRERWPGGYKTKGTPLVYLGQDVLPDQPVIRLDKKEHVEALATAPRLSLPGVIDASTKLNYNLHEADIRASTQHVGETLPAGLRGKVVDITRRGGVIIESYAAVLQGTIGVGNQVAGVLTMWQSSDAGREQPTIPPGALLAVPGPLNFAMLRQAIISGVVGVIASSISSRDLEGFLRTDLIELISSVDVDAAQAHLPHMTILLTEGLGTMAMPARTVNLLKHYQGSIALLSGATFVRQGIFPELIISLPLKEIQQNWHPARPDPTLTLGAQVRICSGIYEGAIGTVSYLYAHQQVFLSGVLARAVHLRLEDGSMITVPITLLERIS